MFSVLVIDMYHMSSNAMLCDLLGA